MLEIGLLKMVGREYSHMISNPKNHKYNLVMYRKALNKLRTGKCAVYPKVDCHGDLVLYVLHTKRKLLRGLCMYYIKCPTNFLRGKYRYNTAIQKKKQLPRQIFYVKLTDIYSKKFLKYMKNHNDWKLV